MSHDPYLDRLAEAVLLVPFAGATAPRWVLEGLERGLGGVTLFATNDNVPGPTELAATTEALRSSADPVISIDEEGGDVTRLAHATGSPYPGNAALGVVDDVDTTRRVYRSLGAELRDVGINLDLAPSVDVNTADDNPIIGTRAFGSDPKLVGRHAAAAVTGLQEAGVAACAKHFPGHGATSQDSHLEIPLIDADLDLLDRRELEPFRAAIAASTQAVMTGHLRIPALTGEEPATLSHAAVTGLLREKLGYQGPVISDALDMDAASGAFGIPEAAVRSLAAGVDLLCLGTKEYEESVCAIRDAIVTAVGERRLTGERLEEAAVRVDVLKTWMHGTTPAGVDATVGRQAARRALRVHGTLPVLRDPLLVQLGAPANIAVGPVPWGLISWVDDPVHADVETADVGDLVERAKDRPLVVVVRDAHRYAEHRALVRSLVTARPDAVVVEMGLPMWRPDGVTHIATYGATHANARAAAEALGLTPAS